MDEWDKNIKAKADLWFGTTRATPTDVPTAPMPRVTMADLQAAIKPSSRPESLVSPSTSISVCPLPSTSEADRLTCPGCDGITGYYKLPVRLGHPDFGRLIECEVCGLVRERRQARQEAEHRERVQRALDELRRRLGHMADCSFDNFDANRELVPFELDGKTISVAVQRKKLTEALTALRTYASEPRDWLYLYGPPGAGKSHLAAAVANALAREGYALAYESVPELLAFVKHGFEDGSADERFDALKVVDVLILDDIGTENPTPWAKETLFRLVNERVNRMEGLTIFTSNMHADKLDFRIASRIMQRSKLVWLPIADIRRLPR